MAGDYTHHDRLDGIMAACTYLASKKIGHMYHWGNGFWEFRIPKKMLVVFKEPMPQKDQLL